ncbi:MAG: sigma-54-dependent Fis family transcriptional regulator [Deltaproteobacteria bacterium]|nr:MAG: sigma-54-dependent Fis family transcriptional regulator [Deltaproteobacteria bacterium]RLB85998.1 MAG: sigma-54-dependent Fis family transcriptional regulator [Deltaproteobacteria bacterium]
MGNNNHTNNKTLTRVLIVDDEDNMRHMLKVMLTKAGYMVSDASNGVQALEALAGNHYDFILCDIRMPEMDGLAFLKAAHEKFPEKTIIMMSAYGTIETALEAMKMGAYDYISKPFKSDEVLLTLKKAEERERLKRENIILKQQLEKISKRYSFGNIIARSEAMAKVFDLVDKVADHKTTVLITGESGTGKELIARAIHENGARASGPLVCINCGGIPENLLESELFGYKKGAFTDAVRDKPGRFEEANGGTIFLDEIGDLPLPLQVKLLRVLQEEEITPLGDIGSKKVDVRIIAATSKDLEREVKEGRFREDLFYRINVMTIHLPPLRDRRGDIPLLVGYFIDLFNKKLKKNIEGLSSEAMPILMAYSWPGNVRELENVIERAILLAQGRWITPAELPSHMTQHEGLPSVNKPEETLSLKKASKRLERTLIEKALKLTNGNRSKAARILEISRPMLLSKIREYNLE